MLKKKKGQSTLEYVILISGVVALILWAAATFIREGVNQSVTDAKDAVEKVAGHIDKLETP